MRRIFNAWDRVFYEIWPLLAPRPRYAVVRLRSSRR